MITYIYKAYDQLGNKKAGKVAVHTILDARRILRERHLNPYFLEDFKVVKQNIRRRRKRRRIIVAVGAVLIAAALVLSGIMVGYAGRERAPDYSKTGVLKGGSGNLVADTDQGRAFARNIYQAWQSFAPGVINGIEVRKHLMTIYVGRAVRRMSESDLEVLATNSIRALQREFKSNGGTLLIIEDDLTIMEVRYNSFTKSTNIIRYK